jgi:hypothetical protein
MEPPRKQCVAMNPTELLDMDQAAAHLGIAPRTLRKVIDRSRRWPHRNWLPANQEAPWQPLDQFAYRAKNLKEAPKNHEHKHDTSVERLEVGLHHQAR